MLKIYEAVKKVGMNNRKKIPQKNLTLKKTVAVLLLFEIDVNVLNSSDNFRLVLAIFLYKLVPSLNVKRMYSGFIKADCYFCHAYLFVPGNF